MFYLNNYISNITDEFLKKIKTILVGVHFEMENNDKVSWKLIN